MFLSRLKKLLIQSKTKLKTFQLQYVEGIDLPQELFKNWVHNQLFGPEVKCIKLQKDVGITFKQNVKDIGKNLKSWTPKMNEEVLMHCDKIVQWNCTEITGKFNLNRPNIFSEIKEINFSRLLSLQLFDCHIETVEPITRMRAPGLQTLNLGKNNITSFRSLLKLNTSSLYVINISKNKVRQLQHLNEFNSDCFQTFILSSQYDTNQDLNHVTLKDYLKMGFIKNNNENTNFQISQKGIDQQIVQKMLNQIFTQLKRI